MPSDATNLPDTWPVYNNLLEGGIILAVMGVTGSGKSTFIKRLGGKRQVFHTTQQPKVGHGLDSGIKHNALF
jgi:ribosome biogenesis GTPase A